MTRVEVRLYNSLRRPGELVSRRLQVERETTVGELVRELGINGEEVYVAFRNGKPLGRGLAEAADTVLQDGDVIALSGPVPFSWGYGAPVV